MNKNYRTYSLLMGFLSLSSLSFSMGNVPKIIYCGSKIITKGILPFVAMREVYKVSKVSAKKAADLPAVQSESPMVQEWAENIIQQAGVCPAGVSLKYGSDWSSESYNSEKNIMIPFAESILLESALRKQRNEHNWSKMSFFEKAQNLFFGPNEGYAYFNIKNHDQYVDQASMILKHEVGHIVANDCKNAMRMKLVMPIVIEAACSGVTYNFNRLCKISPPKTIMKSLGRSTFAFVGLVPKAICSSVIYRPYFRYQETKADKFACENAATKNELEAFYGFFKGIELNLLKKTCKLSQLTHEEVTEKMLRLEHDVSDFHHPYPADRADMVQKYIDKWDAEHPEDKQ